MHDCAVTSAHGHTAATVPGACGLAACPGHGSAAVVCPSRDRGSPAAEGPQPAGACDQRNPAGPVGMSGRRRGHHFHPRVEFSLRHRITYQAPEAVKFHLHSAPAQAYSKRATQFTPGARQGSPLQRRRAAGRAPADPKQLTGRRSHRRSYAKSVESQKLAVSNLDVTMGSDSKYDLLPPGQGQRERRG